MRVIGLAGWSGAGKTTLLAKLIPALVSRGLVVSTVKHAHHAFDIDRPGKDSWVHREAGAREVLVASGARWALMHELRGAAQPDLEALLARLAPCDLVLVEGFKRDPLRKIEVYRAGNGKPYLFPDDPAVVALASDAPPPSASVPYVPLDDVEAVVALVLAHAASVQNRGPLRRKKAGDVKTGASSRACVWSNGAARDSPVGEIQVLIRMRIQKLDPSVKPGTKVGLIGKASATKGARDTLLLVLAGVPDDRLDAFVEDYARRKLAPVVAAKIRAEGGDPERGDAALVVARALLEDAVKRRREGDMQGGSA